MEAVAAGTEEFKREAPCFAELLPVEEEVERKELDVTIRGAGRPTTGGAVAVEGDAGLTGADLSQEEKKSSSAWGVESDG